MLKINLKNFFPDASKCKVGDCFEFINESGRDVSVYKLGSNDVVNGDEFNVIHDYEKKIVTIENKYGEVKDNDNA